jgi:hypothetical protein
MEMNMDPRDFCHFHAPPRAAWLLVLTGMIVDFLWEAYPVWESVCR